MIEVEAPDGTIAEFPADTPREVIAAAMRRRFGAQQAAPEPARPQRATGVLPNIAAGLNEAVTGLVGAPVDLMAGGVNAITSGVNAVAGTNIPRIENPIGGSQSIRDALGVVGASPDQVAPANDLERTLRGAARGAGEAVGTVMGGAALQAGARAGSAMANAGRALQMAPTTQVMAGAAGGAVGAATDSALAGLATSVAVPVGLAAAGRVVSPMRSTLTPEQQRLAAVAAQEGINLSPGQQMGNRPLRTVEAVFDQLPLTSGPQSAIRDQQGVAFNRAVGRRAGIDSDRLTPEVLQANQQRLGGEFERLSQGVVLRADQQAATDLAEVIQRYGNKLPSQQREVFNNYLTDLAGTNGTLTGEQYQILRSDLRRQANAAQNADPYFAEALRGLRRVVDDLAERSLPADRLADWQQARRQYAAQRVIAGAMNAAGEAGTSGNLSPANLRAQVTRGDREGYAMGRGELNDLARVGQAFMRATPDSGTAQRAGTANLLTLGWASGSGAAMFADPTMGAVAFGAPRLTQMLYNSPAVQAYLTNQAAAGYQPMNALAGILTGRAASMAAQPE